MSYKSKVKMDTTDNRYVYNRSRKIYLEQKGKIRCSRCGYHRGENDKRKYYGTIRFWRNNGSRVRNPNWKLVSKNRKQWMKKPTKIRKSNFEYWREHFEIKF